jgi:Tfp pilus assembly protein PilF
MAGALSHRWLLVALLAVTVATYHAVVRHAFVVDDMHTIVGNPSIRSLGHAGQWLVSGRAASGIPEEAAYRPVTVASLAVDYALWNGRAAGFHATNLLIHLGVIVLAFALARRLWGDALSAFLAAAVVALHPVNAEVVNYVSARSSALAALLALGAVLAHDLGRANRAAQAASYGLCLAALGAKETAVMVPLLIIVWDRARHGEGEPWPATLVRSLPFWLLAVAFVGLRAWILRDAISAPTPWPGMTLGMNLAFGLKIILASLRYWVWPAGLTLDHAWPPIIPAAEIAGLVAGTVALLFGARFITARAPRMGWCLAWFTGALLPLIALPFVTRITLYQDHRLYLAGIGLAWMIAHPLASLLRSGPRLRTATVAGLIVVGAIGVWFDRRQTATWATDTTVWDHVLVQTPTSALGHSALGMRRLHAGRLHEARESLEHAVTLDPYFAPLRDGLGRVYARLGRWEDAARTFTTVIASDPRYYARARLPLGEAYEALGRMDAAREEYERLAATSSVEAPRAMGRLGQLLERDGRVEDAAVMYERGLALDPRDTDLLDAAGSAALRLGRWDRAIDVYRHLLRRQPASVAAHLGLAAAFEGGGRRDEALGRYRAVQESGSATRSQRDAATDAIRRLTDGPASPRR